MEGDELRKYIAGPLGVAFWILVLALWSRRKKSTGGDTGQPNGFREKSYFLGRKVRSAWNALTQNRPRI